MISLLWMLAIFPSNWEPLVDGLGLLVPPLLVPPLLVPAAVPPIISPGRIAPGKPGFDAHHKLVLFGQNPGRFILYVYMFMYIYIIVV